MESTGSQNAGAGNGEIHEAESIPDAAESGNHLPAELVGAKQTGQDPVQNKGANGKEKREKLRAGGAKEVAATGDGAGTGGSDQNLLSKKKDRQEAEAKLELLSTRRTTRLSIFAPYSLVIAIYGGFLATRYSGALGMTPRAAFGLVVSLAVVVFPVLLYVFIQLPVNSAREKLARIDQDLDIIRLGNTTERIVYYGERLYRLTAKMHATAFEDDKRREMASRLQKDADEAVNRLQDPSKENLSRASSSLNELESVIQQEKASHRDETRWKYLAIVVIVIYIAMIGGCIWFDQTLVQIQRVLDIPKEIILWAAFGSLAAILYRFFSEYKELTKIRFDYEFRWLIARPIIGIIMGAVAYIAVLAGLFVLNTASRQAPTPNTEDVVPHVASIYCVMAFMAGFSDRFYIGIINLLVSKTLSQSTNSSGATSTQNSAA